MWGLSKSEMRRSGAEMLYELETGFREDDWPSDFVYDAEHDLYRFADGRSPSPGSTQTSGGCVRRASSSRSERGISFAEALAQAFSARMHTRLLG